jgi:hypothetical protein
MNDNLNMDDSFEVDKLYLNEIENQTTNMNKTLDHQTLTNNIQTNLRLTKTLLNILWTERTMTKKTWT